MGNDLTKMARLAFEAYSKQRKGVTFDGREIPAWEDLGSIQDAWIHAARAVADEVNSDSN